MSKIHNIGIFLTYLKKSNRHRTLISLQLSSYVIRLEKRQAQLFIAGCGLYPLHPQIAAKNVEMKRTVIPLINHFQIFKIYKIYDFLELVFSNYWRIQNIVFSESSKDFHASNRFQN
jgi:hypothetical protein